MTEEEARAELADYIEPGAGDRIQTNSHGDLIVQTVKGPLDVYARLLPEE